VIEKGASRLDRLPWGARTCVALYGVRLGIRTNLTPLAKAVAGCLPPGCRPSRSREVDETFSLWADPSGSRPSRLYVGGRRRARSRDLAQLLALLESELRLCVAARATRRTFVHAGVVGWRGVAIVLPGRSRSGKTTLVAELIRAGASYLSDEFAVLDARGRVHPFAKPLSIRGEGGCDRHVQRPSAEALGGRSARSALPVGLVVLATHRPGASWAPSALSPGHAVLEMLAHTVPARLRPAESLRALERAVARAVVVKGERGEAAELAPRLLRMLEEAGAQSRRAVAGATRAAR